MRARSISPSMRLPGERRLRARVTWRALATAVRRQATSSDYARIQARIDAARTEHERRYLQAGGRRWS